MAIHSMGLNIAVYTASVALIVLGFFLIIGPWGSAWFGGLMVVMGFILGVIEAIAAGSRDRRGGRMRG